MLLLKLDKLIATRYWNQSHNLLWMWNRNTRLITNKININTLGLFLLTYPYIAANYSLDNMDDCFITLWLNSAQVPHNITCFFSTDRIPDWKMITCLGFMNDLAVRMITIEGFGWETESIFGRTQDQDIINII